MIPFAFNITPIFMFCHKKSDTITIMDSKIESVRKNRKYFENGAEVNEYIS